MNTASATKPVQRPAAVPPQNANAVVTAGDNSTPAKPQGVGEALMARSSQFQAALPAHIPLERFMRVVMTAVQRNPDLAHADRASLFTSAIQAAQDGLLPDGREGALVIYNSKVKEGGKEIWVAKVQWMPMVAGIRKKVRNSGEISTWEVQVVHANDHFEFELGDDPFIKHRPFMDGDRGPIIAAYSVATLKTGEKSREVMTKTQIDKVRAASKSRDKGPWVDWYDEMCRKTVARRHSKVLPMSTDLDDVIRRDDDLYDMKGAREEAQIANGGRPQSLASRLDVLANAAGRENAPPVERETADEPAHDPDTGEIQDEAAGGTVTTADAGADQQPGGETMVDPAKAALIEKLTAKARKGTKALKLGIGGISDAEEEMLTDEDRAALDEVALRADDAREVA
ncbi:recombinase RecT [Beijerinckia sp. L45]|uniref:recombinase RecT n=1 Tax=Beijerinckia sp. L45 TaxID=1641855 RepID=UPI00131C8168|nr:recombinase RecT [Beijerinckia sp. L45]